MGVSYGGLLKRPDLYAQGLTIHGIVGPSRKVRHIGKNSVKIIKGDVEAASISRGTSILGLDIIPKRYPLGLTNV